MRNASVLLCCLSLLFGAGCKKSSGSSSATSTGNGAATSNTAGNAATGSSSGTTSPTPTSSFQLISTHPLSSATGVAADARIRLRFSASLDPASVTAASAQLRVAGREVRTIQHVQGDLLELEPFVVMAAGELYTVELSTALRSVAGDPLTAATAFSFETDPSAPRRGLVFQAGVAVVDITPPVGVPLGGFGEGARRLFFPDLSSSNYYTWFAPSQGVRDPILAKALVLDDGVDRVALVSLDIIASDNRAAEAIFLKLAQRGVALDPHAIMTCASHTHSGPGTITESRFWELAAMDYFQPTVFDALVTGIADALEMAVQNLQPAALGLGLGQLSGVSLNRRAGTSPNYQPDSIDPDLGVIRIDKPDGTPLATVYNYAIHGLAYWSDNMEYSADLMGEASAWIETQLGGTALFVNGAEGDINPDRSLASSDPAIASLIGQLIGDATMQIHAQATPELDVDIAGAWAAVDMGTPFMWLGATAINPVPAFIQNFLGNIPTSWGITITLTPQDMDREFRFQAVRLQRSLLSSIPGEAIHEVGLEVKAAGAAYGFEHTFVAGLANGHMSYITTPQEYQFGGYEGAATLFGSDTGTKVVDACKSLMPGVLW